MTGLMDTMWPTFLKDGDAVRNTTTLFIKCLVKTQRQHRTGLCSCIYGVASHICRHQTFFENLMCSKLNFCGLLWISSFEANEKLNRYRYTLLHLHLSCREMEQYMLVTHLTHSIFNPIKHFVERKCISGESFSESR